MKRALDWLDRRTGYRGALATLFDEELRGGASLAYTLGRGLLMIVIVQAVTGMLLMATYVPSVSSAWSSVYYVQYVVTAGWFIRGMHHYGASAVMIVMGLHLFQVVVYGAYKSPREVSWWSGLVLMKLVMGLALTGYLLPWDQQAYWASMVTTSVAGGIPLVGPTIKQLVIGGIEYGQLTISRFYFLHVVVLPLSVVLVFFAHYALFRRHGVTPAGDTPPARRTGEPYLRRQVWMDLVVGLLVIGSVAAFAIHERGAPLDAPADPSVDYPPRPEWYFRFLFQLFKLLPGNLEVLASVVLPGMVALFLVALPFLDRADSNRLKLRWRWVAPVLFGLIGVIALTAHSLYLDSKDVDYIHAKHRAKQRAQRAIELARAGIPPDGPLAMLARDPLVGGGDLYRTHCTKCHVLGGEGEREAPDHDGFGSREWILGMMHHPQDVQYFGTTKIDDMPSQKKLGEPALKAIAEFLYAQGQEPGEASVDKSLIPEGERLFQTKCMRCHTFENDGDFDGIGGPELTGYASRLWIYRQTMDPEKHYGDLNEMPAFNDELTAEEGLLLARFLRLQRYQPAATVPSARLPHRR
ncbi:MAG: cytochrome b N-terminal domain-containing protein [Myxococcales bacterium]|nr:cytochrome b N-terminal domain-containing protein [Myxococcales bacterium]MCB9708163.1 cytochrome b N-terminal domain-containing protein [Myxococcales bacterium]